MQKSDIQNYTRSKQITRQYIEFIKLHVQDVVDGRAADFMQLKAIASTLALSHKHLISIIKAELGNHPCHFYDAEIISQAKTLLKKTNASIADIAVKLTYDPSNFSKFFKKWTGITPGAFRENQ